MAKQVRTNNKKLKSKSKNNKASSKRNSKSQFKNKSGARSGVKKRPASKSKVQDARQKILQKKRKTVKDAREILTKMAKTRDARSKLESLRTGRSTQTNRSNIKVIGSNIVQKIDRNGKISLVTNKTRNTSEINQAIQKQLGILPSSRTTMKRSPPKRSQVLKSTLPVRKTIVNDLNYNSPIVEEMNRVFDSNLYKWVKPDLRPASHLIGSLEPTRQAMRDVMREELLLASSRWPDLMSSKSLRLQPSSYVNLIEEDEEMPMVPTRISLQGSKRMSDVHSRLDSAPIQSRSHGILSATKTKVVVPAGHRIVVSNLQPSVTEDDIKELFEDIGQLLSAKLVRAGVAEVIYKNLVDAQKAVDTYHNRQLDGQPMKCLLVNKRPLNHPTAPPITKSENSGRKIPVTNAPNKLVPDISTIHKVLFQRK